MYATEIRPKRVKHEINRHIKILKDNICPYNIILITINGAAIYPREVVKRALELNAAALIVAHNHPSGVAEPSRADLAITARLKQALELVDIRLLDHCIVAGAEVVSLAERGGEL